MPSLALIIGPLLQHKGRLLLSVIAIALGVALGYAVQLINRAAIAEFGHAVRMLAGEADLTVRGPRGGFDESVYPLLAAQPEIAALSPLLEIDARIAGGADSLRVYGIDIFRAARVQPGLLPQPDAPLDVLRADTVFLSHAAAQSLGLAAGDTLSFQVGLERIDFRVAGLVPGVGGGQRLGVVDISAAQQRFARLGTLNRIDLRLQPGVAAAGAQARLASLLPPGVYLERPEIAADSGAALSRSYRVNLNVLALVALFTGGLLVFSAQVLSVVRRRAQLALLRVLGVTRRGLLALLLAESALIGMAGGVAGLLLGAAAARLVLGRFGADLGAGLFAELPAQASFDPVAALVFLLLGVGAAVLGSLLPSLEAARAQPAQALKSGDEARLAQRLTPALPGVALLLLGGACALLPPVRGLPLFGYLSIALLLLGTIALMPRLAAWALTSLPTPRRAEFALGLSQLRAAPGQAMVSLASIVAAVSLAASVAIMVGSFRTSLELWLEHILPADLFVRTSGHGETGFLSPQAQAALQRVPGVRRVEFLAGQQIQPAAGKPRITLLGRDVDARSPGRTLMLTGPVIVPGPADPPPVWVSEIAAERYDYRPGAVIRLPVGGREAELTVAGIWRDYARMQGALMLDLALYRRLTGDDNVSDAGLWLEPGADAAEVLAALRAALPDPGAQVSEPAELRALSLAIFDRTFAVTYALEAVAIVIGLAGLSASFGALTLSRRREFGMLRHIGVSRAQVRRMLAFEGALVSALGVGVGLALGWLMSLVLIHVVNRQSFHWSMDLHMPWLALSVFGLAMLAAAMSSATLSARRAMSGDVIRAVKEDW
jgi:putative ABC transport system permease protein